MGDQLANNPEALRLFFNEDIYLLEEAELATAPTAAAGSIALTFKEDPAAQIPTLQEQPSPVYTSERDSLRLKEEQAGGELAKDPAGNQSEQEITFSYKGKNARNILILVYDEVNDVTTAQGRELFKNIVKAKELSGSDYAIVNYAGYKDATFAQLKRFFNAKAILTFGVKASQLGLAEYPTHTVVQHEGVQLLFSIDLHQISLDKNIKRALWAGLQQMEL
jgi:DNA polymerase III psi subunit